MDGLVPLRVRLPCCEVVSCYACVTGWLSENGDCPECGTAIKSTPHELVTLHDQIALCYSHVATSNRLAQLEVELRTNEAVSGTLEKPSSVMEVDDDRTITDSELGDETQSEPDTNTLSTEELQAALALFNIRKGTSWTLAEMECAMSMIDLHADKSVQDVEVLGSYIKALLGEDFDAEDTPILARLLRQPDGEHTSSNIENCTDFDSRQQRATRRRDIDRINYDMKFQYVIPKYPFGL